ncbi:MAG TPA: hypothetical protein IAB51_06600 [Candidatus Merdivicinus excrementipullorum]|uniref:Uncharacterized protein n=1 Tax=Candidatus Merdivicinus excrementipullorum TaxID=2840867 RepID=A0A9D1FMW6_9FIRM|nr:hypothetical protein [Candidatus Merdivicinus excrementipullorum]
MERQNPLILMNTTKPAGAFWPAGGRSLYEAGGKNPRRGFPLSYAEAGGLVKPLKFTNFLLHIGENQRIMKNGFLSKKSGTIDYQ